MRRRRLFFSVSAVGLVAALAAGCSDDQASTPQGIRCSAEEPCPGALACLGGVCVDPGAPDVGDEEVCEGGGPKCGVRCCGPGYTCGERSSCACQSEIVCAGACCADGQSCEAGQCVNACDGTRCGADLSACCSGSEVCASGACIEPGAVCSFTEECAAGQRCEPLLGRCIPAPAERCEVRPKTGDFTPEVGCRWQAKRDDPAPNSRSVVMAPIVMDLVDGGEEEGAEIPEIAFVTFDEGLNAMGRPTKCCSEPGVLRIVSGACGEGGAPPLLVSIAEPAILNDNAIAAGDLDGDGRPEIVGVTASFKAANGGVRPQGLVAFEWANDDGTEWRVKWHNTDSPAWSQDILFGAPTIAIANVDGAGAAEVVVGAQVFDGETGALKWDGATSFSGVGDPGKGHNLFGPASIVVDVEGDGQSEIFAGSTLYNANGTTRWAKPYDGARSWCRYDNNASAEALPITCDGYNAAADLDGDNEVDLVAARLGEIFVWGADGEEKWRAEVPYKDCVGSIAGATRRLNESGPPTVADFDGDGRPEIGTAGADYYAVMDLDCDETLGAGRQEGCASDGVLWRTPNFDCSSRSTASSVFDFEGDGSAEVVYVDEQNLYIMRGIDGEILYKYENHHSNTRIELPIIADIDNDNHAEIIFSSVRHDGFSSPGGIQIVDDAENNWVRTRRVWNQHSYHVTNIAESGAVPLRETPNWTIERLNNYRQNVQPSGLFDAPDLIARSVRAGQGACASTGALAIWARVGNDGALGMPPGVAWQIWAVSEGEAGRELVAQGRTTARLLPGQTEAIETSWSVPPAFQPSPFQLELIVDPDNEHKECHEENSALFGPFFCSVAG